MATLLLIIIYIAFISLGLPDAMLGAAWPAMQREFGISYSLAGLIHMLIAGGTIVSSLSSGYLLKRFDIGKITAVSVALTAVALFGFSLSPSFIWLLAAAVPLGLGAGSIDAALNAYVASHYASRHMSWLHSFWGVGALSGPLVISLFLARDFTWRAGYLSIGAIQVLLFVGLLAALPLWNKIPNRKNSSPKRTESKSPSFLFALKLKGAPWTLITFLIYCGIESTMGLWGASFLFKVKGMDMATSAQWVSGFFISITIGRFITGFVTYYLSNENIIRIGTLIITSGAVLMLLPLPYSLAGFALIGFGCAPIYPCLLHETPVRFGEEHAGLLMGFQMAVAYIGATFLPPLFGFLASATTIALFPAVLLGYAIILTTGSEVTRKLFNVSLRQE